MLDYVLLFESLTRLMEFELWLSTQGVSHRVEPIPTHLSSSCGMCIALGGSTLRRPEVKAQLEAYKHRTYRRLEAITNENPSPI